MEDQVCKAELDHGMDCGAVVGLDCEVVGKIMGHGARVGLDHHGAVGKTMSCGAVVDLVHGAMAGLKHGAEVDQLPMMETMDCGAEVCLDH